MPRQTNAPKTPAPAWRRPAWTPECAIDLTPEPIAYAGICARLAHAPSLVERSGPISRCWCGTCRPAFVRDRHSGEE